MKICITSVGSATAVNLIKLIKMQSTFEVEVIGIDVNQKGYTSGSQMVDKFFQCPMANTENYINFIKNFIEEEKIDLIIPIHDLEISKFVSCTKINTKIVLPSKMIFGIFNDKYNASVAVKAIGVEIPPILSDTKNKKIEKVIIRDKVAVGSKGIKVCSFQEYSSIYDELNQNITFAQKFISGDEYTVDVFSDLNGIPKLIVPRKRIEVKEGVATKVKIEDNKELIKLTKTILKTYPIPGFCNLQFIISEGVPYFIELNPRFGGMGISSSLVSFNYMELFIKHFIRNEEMLDFNYYMSRVKWDAIVTRYFEETVYHG